MRKKIIITGASSQIGDFLLPLLKQKQHEVLPLSRAKQQNIHATWIQTDIAQPHTVCQQLPDADVLIHIAPLPLLPPLLSTIKEKGIKRLIVFGSTSMFGKQTSHSPKEQAMVAEFQQAERDIANYCQREGIDWTIFRPTLIYGCGKDKNVTFIAKKMKQYHFFPLVGKASGLRQPVHSEDLALACVQALTNPRSYNKAYNLSGGETMTYKRILQRIIEIEQVHVVLFSIPLLLFRVLIRVANTLPAYRYLTPDMANRMNQDLCFDHQKATDDFSYNPKAFQPPKIQ
ncbi:MAG: NAD(P)-dependent oxidoreductase [Mariprofundaceae bacterium]|nr:NAD(P)-dependent oxidoreductase [Mariprofundaceae bacterium]